MIKSAPRWLVALNSRDGDDQQVRWLSLNSGGTSSYLTSSRQSNKIVEKLGDPQEQRVQKSALFTLTRMRQAAHCYSRRGKAKGVWYSYTL